MDNYIYEWLPRSQKRSARLAHRFRRAMQKFGLAIHKGMNPLDRRQLSEAEREAYTIFRKMAHDPENELLTSPLSGKYYLKSDAQSMLLVLGNGQLSIVNHVYGYNVPLSQKTESKMKDIFVQEVELRRVEMEREYTDNIKHSLKSIIQRMNHDKS